MWLLPCVSLLSNFLADKPCFLFSAGTSRCRLAQSPHFRITILACNRSRQFREPEHPDFPNSPRPERIRPGDAFAREHQQIAALDGEEACGFFSGYKGFSRHTWLTSCVENLAMRFCVSLFPWLFGTDPLPSLAGQVCTGPAMAANLIHPGRNVQ